MLRNTHRDDRYGSRALQTRFNAFLPISEICKSKQKQPNAKLGWNQVNPSEISGLYMICRLSKHEAEKEVYTDSLMLDHEGNIAEATGANVFF